MLYHDIVVGDFGRPGTVRYFSAFSLEERRFINKALDIESFYDEHRRIRYSIIGSLRDIKAPLLPENDEDIDDRVLVGVEGGSDTDAITSRLVDLVIPYCETAIRRGATRIRIIIPCNTLFEIATRIDALFADGETLVSYCNAEPAVTADPTFVATSLESVQITAPVITDTVVRHLHDQGKNRLLVAASKDGLAAYRQTADKLDDDITVREYLPGDVKDFNDLVSRSIAGKQIPTHNTDDSSNTTAVSGCTDFHISGTVDSTKVFAQELVTEAYNALFSAQNSNDNFKR